LTFLRNIDLRAPRRSEAVPLMAAVALTALAVLQALLPVSPNSPNSSSLAPRRVPIAAAPMTKDYDAVLGAALFAPDRPQVPGVLDMSGTLDGYRALGVAIAGPLVSAVVQSHGGPISRIALGRALDGWTLAGATTSRLVFTRGNEQRVLLISRTREIEGTR